MAYVASGYNFLLGRRVKRLFLTAATLSMFAVVVGQITSANADDDSAVRVMTRNLYQCTNFEEAVAATTPAQFIAAVTTIYTTSPSRKPIDTAAKRGRGVERRRQTQ